MIISIVAVELNNGIGYKGSMPWPRLPEDMKWFKNCTANDNVVIMGSTTWKGFHTPLPNRVNVVISKQMQLYAHHTFSDPVDAINAMKVAHPDKDIYIIGGQALYDSTISLVDAVFVTEIDENYKCDKFFNMQYVLDNFKTVSLVQHIDKTLAIPAYTIKKYSK